MFEHYYSHKRVESPTYRGFLLILTFPFCYRHKLKAVTCKARRRCCSLFFLYMPLSKVRLGNLLRMDNSYNMHVVLSCTMTVPHTPKKPDSMQAKLLNNTICISCRKKKRRKKTFVLSGQKKEHHFRELRILPYATFFFYIRFRLITIVFTFSLTCIIVYHTSLMLNFSAQGDPTAKWYCIFLLLLDY